VNAVLPVSLRNDRALPPLSRRRPKSRYITLMVCTFRECIFSLCDFCCCQNLKHMFTSPASTCGLLQIAMRGPHR
jgi:hypothetical protein